jgi:polyphosphate kinase 2 (PPK2 family)
MPSRFRRNLGATLGAMDEARRVIERLDRIDALRNEGAAPAMLLGEVRWLLREGEEWLAAERARGSDAAGRDADLERARDALEQTRARLDGASAPSQSEEGVIVGIGY